MANGRWDVIMSNILGGVAGIFLFTFLGVFLETLYFKHFPHRKFSKSSRFLAHIKDKFGIWGIALVSPIISFPVAILLSLTLTTHKWEIVKKMIVSLIGWTTVLYIAQFIIRHL